MRETLPPRPRLLLRQVDATRSPSQPTWLAEAPTLNWAMVLKTLVDSMSSAPSFTILPELIGN
jgi:hypothetical protein